MDAETALSLRMTSLLLGERSQPDVAGVVEWFGAMQAQDLHSVLWSLGTRLPGAAWPEVVAATERRDVVRTWPMRGTVHLIPSADAHWMLELTGCVRWPARRNAGRPWAWPRRTRTGRRTSSARP